MVMLGVISSVCNTPLLKNEKNMLKNKSRGFVWVESMSCTIIVISCCWNKIYLGSTLLLKDSLLHGLFDKLLEILLKTLKKVPKNILVNLKVIIFFGHTNILWKYLICRQNSCIGDNQLSKYVFDYLQNTCYLESGGKNLSSRGQVFTYWRCFLEGLCSRLSWNVPDMSTRMIAHPLQWPGTHMKPCLGKLMRLQKIYQDLWDTRNSYEVWKNASTKTQLSQYRTQKAPWPKYWWPWEAPHCCAPLKDRLHFWQILIKPSPATLEGATTPIAGNGNSRFLPLWEHCWQSSEVHKV